MAIGERIRFFRNLRGMTQKYLGQLVGFSAATADIRMAQYEAGKRTPKADLIEKLAYYLEVSPQALTVPDIDSYYGLMHTLFVLEDKQGFRIDKIDGELCLHLDKSDPSYHAMFDMLHQWWNEAEKLKQGEITKEDYDRWRYNYPRYDTTQRWGKVPSQELSDALTAAFKDKLDTD